MDLIWSIGYVHCIAWNTHKLQIGTFNIKNQHRFMVETAKKQLSDLHILNVSFLQNSQEKLHCIEMFAAPYTNKLLERKVSLSLSLWLARWKEIELNGHRWYSHLAATRRDAHSRLSRLDKDRERANRWSRSSRWPRCIYNRVPRS